MNMIRRWVMDYYRRVTGHTELLMQNAHLLEPIKKPRIVICVNRRTLSNKFYREYRRMGFKINDGKSKEAILGDRVIVCYPSIWRFSTRNRDFRWVLLHDKTAIPSGKEKESMFQEIWGFNEIFGESNNSRRGIEE